MTADTAQEKEESFWLPLFVLVLAAFAAILNSSSINVATPKLMAIFGVSTNDIQWVLTAYMLTSAVVIPIAGFLGDRFGYKKIYILSTAAFTAGSVLCAFSWSNNSLIIFRIIQALGGGVIMPVSMALIYRIVPMKKIGLALGVWGMAAVMGPAVGPTIGGYILEHFNWRLLFLMNVPIGMLGVFLSIYLLKETPIKENTRFDFWGFIFSAVGLFSLLLALSQGNKEGWDSYYIVMLFVLAFYTLLLFVLVELFGDDPMLDLSLLKNKTFLFSTIVGSLINIGLYGGVFLTPIFTQNLMGLSAYESGKLLFPSAMVSGIMMPISGTLFDKFGAKVVGVIGVAITAMATMEMYHLDINTGKTTVVVLMSIRSFGIGLSMMPLITVGMNVVARQLVGRASSLSNVIRQVASSFGIAVLTTIMQNRQTFHAASLSEGVSYSSPVALSFIKQLQGLLTSSGMATDASSSGSISIIAGLVQKQALVHAIDDTYMISGLFVLAAIPLIFFINEKKKTAS